MNKAKRRQHQRDRDLQKRIADLDPAVIQAIDEFVESEYRRAGAAVATEIERLRSEAAQAAAPKERDQT